MSAQSLLDGGIASFVIGLVLFVVGICLLTDTNTYINCINPNLNPTQNYLIWCQHNAESENLAGILLLCLGAACLVVVGPTLVALGVKKLNAQQKGQVTSPAFGRRRY
jgi:hypothetical protein